MPAENKTEPIEGLLPNVTAAAIAASKRQIVQAMNRLEANGVAVIADPSIWMSDGTEIVRDTGIGWHVSDEERSPAIKVARAKRQIVSNFNIMENNGVNPCAASIALSDGSEINRYATGWQVVV